MENKKYFLGLDVGTDSVGYAATDNSPDFNLIKHRGEPLWGVTLFEAADLSKDRRTHRTERRRVDRRQQRILFVREIFAKEIEKVDKNFYVRLRESALIRKDSEPYCLFNDSDYSDADYHKQYPTIHHLICDLMESDEPHDVRLVYLACAWLVSHRGHFLNDVSIENVDSIFDFKPIYRDLLDYCREYFGDDNYVEPWSLPEDKEEEFGKILKLRGVNNRQQAFKNLLFGGNKIPKIIDSEDGTFPFSVEAIINLLSGKKTKISELYRNPDYEDCDRFSLDASEEEYAAIFAIVGDDGELLKKLRALHDWATLSDLLGGKKYISQAKVAVYEQHNSDLKALKAFVKANYDVTVYNKIFRDVCENNYVAYCGNVKNVKGKIDDYKKCEKREAFCEFLRKTLELNKEENEAKIPEDMLERIKNGSFMPKQVTGDNRVLPYQLYYVELKKILENAKVYLPFLYEKDNDGYFNDKKLLSVMKFRVPYYVGPLNKNSEHAWIERRAEGKIYPWNFDETVDEDASESAFINRMTNTCTYLAGEDVLPKDSLLYQKFVVLNEINNIRICEKPIDVELKQKIYEDLFCAKKKVTYRSLSNYLMQHGVSKDEAATVSGIDKDIKGSMSSHIAFRQLMLKGVLTVDDVESIINRRTCCSDNGRFCEWLKTSYPALTTDDVKYIRALNVKEFGRLSKKLLSEIEGVDKDTGELNTVIGFMWEKNVNLSQLLLSDKYTFADTIKQLNAEYYGKHPVSLDERLNEMYISNAVKRPIIRTLNVVDDIVKATGQAPEKIFIEMARGAKEEEKHKRTKTRKEVLLEYYDKIKTEEVRELKQVLESYGNKLDNSLQGDRLYLYFMQLGKCMYTGEEISIGDLSSKRYDIDHIYPKSRVYDDSILNNKVLVVAEENHNKGDVYPVNAKIRAKMGGFWKMLFDNGLITEEKYRRLTRGTPFTADEEWGFINRQLTETRQSTKALTVLLSEKYPKSEIVFVKAGLVSEFRHEYGMLKSRAINDLHHAKDAYLNVVCGQVYHSVFTKQWFLENRNSKGYTIKTKALFGRTQTVGGENVWNGEKSFAKVKVTVYKNNCHLTSYAFCRQGGFFDQQPKKKSNKPGLIPRKKNLPTEIYGGYQKPKISFFVLAHCKYGKKQDVLILPIELMVADKFMQSEEFAKEYLHSVAERIAKQKVEVLSLPLGMRILKINTVFDVDGFRMCLGGKTNDNLIFKPIVPLILLPEWETYVKKLESFAAKCKKNEKITYDKDYDVITAEENNELYKLLADKLSKKPFALRPTLSIEKIKSINGKCEEFSSLEIKKQAEILLDMVSLFSRSASADKFLDISGACVMSSKLSNWKGKYNSVRIVDSSASGIWERKSKNLLTLI